ncbi:MAG: hypothetical protein HZB42_06705 [Sphingobacteriales bacterium]|nr:hypothetical protein [Sphingobacteriales bacterium]
MVIIIFILDAANDLQAIAAWGSFIVAIVSVIISAIAFFQTKKIKELSDIVNELKNSNELLEKRFNMEKMANLKQSMPIFQIDHINDKKEINCIEIFIKNVGISFQYFNTNNQTNNIAYFQNLNTEASSSGVPMIGVFFRKGEEIDVYEFDIVTKSSTGHEHKQRFIKKHGERADIKPPEY